VARVAALALGLVLTSAALHAIWSVIIKQSQDPVAFNWLQMTPAVVLVPALVIAQPELLDILSGPTDEVAHFWGWAAAAAVSHALYMFCMGRALTDADLTLVYPIARSTPAFLPFVAGPLLGEHVTPGGAVGIATVVAGMWAVYTRGKLQLAALLQPNARFAWLTLFATVAYATTDKGAMASLDGLAWPASVPRPLFYCLITMLGGCIALTPLVLTRAHGAQRLVTCARTDSRRAFGALGFSLVGYTLLLEALRTTPASYVVAVRQTSVLFAVALGAAWLGERPGAARVVGAFVIVGGVAILGIAG